MPVTRLTKSPQVGPRARMYRLLLEQAMAIAQSQQVPSVVQVAVQAKSDWRGGRMKLPDPDHEELVPLPADAAPGSMQ